jgi:hypothetical protein
VEESGKVKRARGQKVTVTIPVDQTGKIVLKVFFRFLEKRVFVYFYKQLLIFTVVSPTN